MLFKLFFIGNNINQTYFKNIISPLFSSQNQELRLNHDQLLNHNFKNNSTQINYNENSKSQNLNHEFIQCKILNRNLKNNPASYDLIIENIIDDLLIENVFELQEIEEKQEKLRQKQHMKSFIKGYYKNFEDIKKLEENVFEKLHNNDYGIRLNPQNSRMVLDGKEDRRHILYKNPFEAAINKSIDQINQNSLIIVENEPFKNKKSNLISNPNNKINMNSALNNKNSNDRKSRSKEKDNKNKNKNLNKKDTKNKSFENKNSKSPESLKSLQKPENSMISIKNEAQLLINQEEKVMNLQEKIKHNFINHLITNDYDFKNNNLISDNNKKSYYVVKLHKNLHDICEKYRKEYDEYMKTTGVFFVPNVFVLYEDVVNKLTNEILEECVSKSLKELDEMALNLIKTEVENKL